MLAHLVAGIAILFYYNRYHFESLLLIKIKSHRVTTNTNTELIMRLENESERERMYFRKKFFFPSYLLFDD